jgi:hypothetical protein
VTGEQPDYGPRGYLPPRAAKRARKIILREPMGLQWAIAALVAGVLVLVAGGVLLVSRYGPPGPPFVAAGDLSQIDPRGAGALALDGGGEVLVLRGGGGVSVFRAPADGAAWCATSARLISPGGAVWQRDGRLVGGTGDSLTVLPAQVHDGVVYVDPEAPGTHLPPDLRDEPTTCPPS